VPAPDNQLILVSFNVVVVDLDEAKVAAQRLESSLQVEGLVFSV
jgi:hypothetical protein